MDDNIYINIKELNELRRNALTKLESKLLLNNRKEKELKELENINTSKEELKLTFKVHTLEQYNYLKSLGYNDIYFTHNSTEKVNNSYNLDSDLVLIEGIKNGKGGLKLLSPLVVHNDDNTYADEVVEILKF